MKKIIALSLVLMLALSMATVAFAADPYADTGEPGEKYKLEADSFKKATVEIAKNYFSAEYFTVSYKVDKGAALLDSVKFNDDGELIVKFKDNYSLEAPKISNFKFKEIKVKAKKDAVDTTNTKIAKNTEFVAAGKALADYTVGYTPVEYKLDQSFTIANGVLAKFAKDNGTSFKDVTFSSGSAYAEFRVFDGDKIFFKVDSTADLDIVKANPDADLEFVTFKSSPKLSSSATLEINADKGDFFYEIKDGKLVKSNFKYDEDGSVFKGKTTTLGSYVVSDIELKNAASSADDTTKNPNTGANDVVGVAVALAVVSLVAAGAVSLKK